MNDIIADMLTRIRNANQMKNENVEVIGSNMTLEIAKILKEEGFIVDYFKEENKNGDKLKLRLKYSDDNERVIKGLRRISKPGLRVYAKNDELPEVLNGLGIAIISTSKGVMTNKKAKAENLGGEVLAFVW